MSSIRVRPRKNADAPPAAQVLWRWPKASPYPGKQDWRTFDDYAAAERWQKVLDAVGPMRALELLDSQNAARRRHEQSLTEFLTEFNKRKTSISQAQRDRHTAYIRNDIGPVIGELPLSAVDEVAIGEFIQALEDIDNSPKTIHNKHGFLSEALAAAHRQGKLSTNPCMSSKLPKIYAAEMVFLEHDEFEILYRHVRGERWQQMVKMLVCTGARFSEVTALTVGDIDAKNMTIRISKAWKYTGKSRRVLGPPKSVKGQRTIDIPPEAIEGVDLKRPAHELVFRTQDNDPITNELFRERCWIPTLTRLADRDRDGNLVTDRDGNIVISALRGKRPRPHDLRHTCASWMINDGGVSMKAIQLHLGHESIKTTYDRYGHLDRQAGKKAAAAISAAFKRG